MNVIEILTHDDNKDKNFYSIISLQVSEQTPRGIYVGVSDIHKVKLG